MFNLATTYKNLRRFQEAEELDIAVLSGRKQLFGESHPDTLDAMFSLALTYRCTGRYKEAEQLEVTVLSTLPELKREIAVPARLPT